MEIFEFHLNPNVQKHTRSRVACYEPSKKEEKHLGSLCVAGELTNILPPNKKLLDKLSGIIKDAYYGQADQRAEAALQYALQKTNNYLGSASRQDNVSWMGNLHLIVLSVAGSSINLSKTGDVKLIMVRDGELLDIGADLEQQSSGAYTQQAFPHLISGKIVVKDKILILTQEIFQLFETLGLLSYLAALTSGKEEKQIKNILKTHEKELKSYSGLLVLLSINKIFEEPTRHSTPSSQAPLSSIKPRIALPTLKLLPKLPSAPKLLPIPRFRPPRIPRLKMFKPSMPDVKSYGDNISLRHWQLWWNKKVFIVAGLIAILAVGYTLSQSQKKRNVDLAAQELTRIQQTIWQAESALILEKTKEANNLFEQALIELAGLKDTPIEKHAQGLTEEVRQKLQKINKIEDISELPILFSPDDKAFNPDKLVRIGDTLYLVDSSRPTIHLFNLTSQETGKTELEKPLSLFAQLEEFLVFYDVREHRLIIPDGPSIELFPPYTGFEPIDLSAFGSFLYFLDSSHAQIVKYQFLRNQKQLIPNSWIGKDTEKIISLATDMAIDGSIWVLTRNGKVHRYFGGVWQETLDISIWPKMANPTKIYTDSDLLHLYILDPTEKRLIILDKQGNTVKQYRSEKLNDLKDFAVSEDGKEIYILSGVNVYKIIQAE